MRETRDKIIKPDVIEQCGDAAPSSKSRETTQQTLAKVARTFIPNNKTASHVARNFILHNKAGVFILTRETTLDKHSKTQDRPARANMHRHEPSGW